MPDLGIINTTVAFVSSILSAGILSALLNVFAKPIDKKLMTFREQKLSSVISVVLAFLVIVVAGWFVSYCLSDAFDVEKKLATGVVIVTMVILVVAMLVLVICKKPHAWLIRSETRSSVASFILMIVFLVSLIFFKKIVPSSEDFIILDAYLSVMVLMSMWRIFNNPQKEASFYISLDSGMKMKEKWYVYRRISDRELLCGRSRNESEIKEYKIVQLTDADLVKKEIDETIEQKEFELDKTERNDTELNETEQKKTAQDEAEQNELEQKQIKQNG